MNISELIWLEDIVFKIKTKHGVDETEVQYVRYNNPHFRFVEKGHREGEHVYAALGTTENGRRLIVFFVFKQSKQALILSARDMTKKENKLYERA